MPDAREAAAGAATATPDFLGCDLAPLGLSGMALGAGLARRCSSVVVVFAQQRPEKLPIQVPLEPRQRAQRCRPTDAARSHLGKSRAGADMEGDRPEPPAKPRAVVASPLEEGRVC